MQALTGKPQARALPSGRSRSASECLASGQVRSLSASRLEEALTKIGPVMGQLFGQSEAPMMISTLAPAEHFHADGSLGPRATALGRPAHPAHHGRDHG